MTIKFQIEKKIRKTLNTFGFDLHRLKPKVTSVNYLVKSLQHFKIDTLFDVGANVGQFSTSLRQVGYKKRIISFEPLSEAYAKLCEQAKSDPLWIIHSRCALGDTIGEAKINIAGNSVSSSLLDMLESHSNAANNSAYVGVEQCAIHTLDSIANDYITMNNRVFLKMDAQGFEWQVLNGAVNTLPFIQGIMLEASLVELYVGQRLWQDFVDRLENEGFELWSIDRGFSDPETGRALQCDMVFWKKSTNN